MKEKLKGFPRCYAVNLEESVERREYMESEWERLGLQGEVCQYKRLEDPECDIVVKGDPEVLKLLPLGTTSSHLLTIKHWYETTDDDMCAVFEDDCDFSTVDKWPFSWEDYIEKLGHVWDGIQLCVMHEGYAVMYPRQRNGFDHGLQCYIVKRHYAKKLIDYYFEDDKTINFKMPWHPQKQPAQRFHPTVENVVYGLGIFYNHPLFNHNIPKFQSTVWTSAQPKEHKIAIDSYKYVHNWWDVKGSKGTLDQLFDYNWCCPPTQSYGNVFPIY